MLRIESFMAYGERPAFVENVFWVVGEGNTGTAAKIRLMPRQRPIRRLSDPPQTFY
jgi:hypothetical protein